MSKFVICIVVLEIFNACLISHKLHLFSKFCAFKVSTHYSLRPGMRRNVHAFLVSLTKQLRDRDSTKISLGKLQKYSI